MDEKEMKKLQRRKRLFKTDKAVDKFIEDWDDVSLWIWNEIFNKYAASPSTSWKDLADRVFSQYVRLYYANDLWFCKCITCWKVMKFEDIQNWHYRSRTSMKYRFDIRNCHPQCFSCNVCKHWDYRNYRNKIVELYWEELEEDMWNSKDSVWYSQWWFEDSIFEWYKFISTKKIKVGIEREKSFIH